jgi:D-alanyl-D-alanine carboxypeptidase
MPRRTTRPAITGVVAVAALIPAADAAAQTSRADRALEQRLARIVATTGGPPGAIATLHRDGRTTVLAAGRADVRRSRSPRANDTMRIASVAKAFSGAVALRLVERGTLGLDDTVGERRPDLPAAWGAVTIRQLLNHTSGIPDYTRSAGFARQLETAPRATVVPPTIIDWVREDPLSFAPGHRYRYSNTDNIVVALIAEAVTGRAYDRLLDELVLAPAGLRHTSLPTTIRVPRPRIRGYVAAGADRLEDMTTAISPTGAWASGGILSTPNDLGRFVRADLGGRFFGAAQQRQQLRFVRGSSSPPGPGRNAAGLAIFRYATRCGTVYGHTGSFPGYTQWVAASRDGSRSVTTTFNLSGPTPRMLGRIRAAQASAVCALLRD